MQKLLKEQHDVISPSGKCNRIREYLLDAMGNRSVLNHYGEDNQQVHSFLAPLMDQILMALQTEVVPCHSFISICEHTVSHLPEPTKAQTFACAVCVGVSLQQ